MGEVGQLRPLQGRYGDEVSAACRGTYAPGGMALLGQS